MNKVKTIVLEVLDIQYYSKIHSDISGYRVKVKVNSYGRIYKTFISVSTKEEALTIQPGYIYES